MRKSEVIKIDGAEITVKELTVEKIKAMVAAYSAGQQAAMNTVDMLFGDVIPSDAVAESSGISIEDLEGKYAPSELNEIVEAVKRVNPFFLAMIAKFTAAAGKLESLLPKK